MRVIKKGHIKEKEAVCSSCGATIGYYEPDIKRMHHSDFIIDYLSCPVCNKPIGLNRQSIPEA